MNNSGKILFFNANDGKGIIITSAKEKIGFSVEDWDDFETMPTLGLEVSFVYENSSAYHIVSLENYVEEDEVESEQEPLLEAQTSEPKEDASHEQEPQEEQDPPEDEKEQESQEEPSEHFEDEQEIDELGLDVKIED